MQFHKLLPLLLITTTSYCSVENFEKVRNYLFKYGYLTAEVHELFGVTADSEKFKSALNTFQQYFNATSNDTDEGVNDETLELVSLPRCGVRDNWGQYSTGVGWHKKNLSWEFVHGTPEQIAAAHAAFNVWSRYADIDFVQRIKSPTKVDIYLSMGDFTHFDYSRHMNCASSFDGEGQVLGHAFFPNPPDKINVDIHMDYREKWDMNLRGTSDYRKTNFFEVLVHEIGHALGIEHSQVWESVMYPMYSRKKFNNPDEYKLHEDDVRAVQNLYGVRRVPAKGPKFVPKLPPQPPIPPPPPPTDVDICDIHNLKNFLIVNDKMFIFYKQWVWMKSIDAKTHSVKPYRLSEYLSFLPQKFEEVSAVYQRPNGNIVIIINDKTYNIKYPSLQLDAKNKSNPYSSAIKNITAAVNTNSGHTFIFHSGGDKFVKIDECSFTTASHGIIGTQFPGIPSGIESAFRYVDGHLYFLKGANFYKYNEFRKMLVKAAPFDPAIFNINCPNISILQQIKNLLNNLSQFTSISSSSSSNV